jgi:hypothetical protein
MCHSAKRHEFAVTSRMLVALVLTALFTTPGFGQSGPGGQSTITKVGTTSGQFLKLGVGARAVALGGSFVAQANDLSALYWNPAGLSQIQGSAAQLSHTEYLADITYNHAGFATNLGVLGTLGFSFTFLDSGDMEVRTLRRPDGTGEQFDAQSMALQLSLGRALTDRFSIGGTAKYVRESIWHSSASTIALDVGVLFTTPYERLKLGASIVNFGSKMRMSGRDVYFSQDPDPVNQGNVEIVNAEFLTEKYPLPLMFRVGLAWTAYQAGGHQLVLSSDAAHPNDNTEYLNMGAEYGFRGLFFVRSGYRNLFEEDGEEGLTLGSGLSLRIDRALRATIDYAYADFGRLEQTHWFTVGLEF